MLINFVKNNELLQERIDRYGFISSKEECQRVVDKLNLKSLKFIASSSSFIGRCHNYAFKSKLCFQNSVDIFQKLTLFRENNARVGNLVIFINNMGRPIHYGIVVKTGSPEEMIIRSKWGASSIFEHNFAEHPYSWTHDVFFANKKEAKQILHQMEIEGKIKEDWF